MTAPSSVAYRTLGSRSVLLGPGNPDALQSIGTEVLDDGCRCYVAETHAEWQLHKDSLEAPDGTTIIAPAYGPGRWFKQVGGGSVTIPFPVDYIDASAVPDGKIIVASAGLAIWGDVPVAFDITGFSHSPGLVQVGAAVTNPSFSASYNQAAASVSLTDTEGHSDVIALPGTSFASPHAFTKNTFGASVTFTLHASNALGADTAATGISWGENVYYGAAVDPGTYDEASIESLTASLRLSASGSYGFNASSTQSSFFCVLTSLGLTINSFFVGGFPFACSRVATNVAVTNAHSITQNYDVFRSDNVGLGDFTLLVV